MWKIVMQCQIENNLIEPCDSMYSTVDSLVETSTIITGSNNIALRKVDVKPYKFGNMYMDNELIEGSSFIK